MKDIIAVRGAGRSIIGGGAMFIYSCSAQLISFEIVIYILNSIVFTVCEHEYMNVAPPPNYRSSGAVKKTKYVV